MVNFARNHGNLFGPCVILLEVNSRHERRRRWKVLWRRGMNAEEITGLYLPETMVVVAGDDGRGRDRGGCGGHTREG